MASRELLNPAILITFHVPLLSPIAAVQRDVQMEESEASTSQCLVPSPVRPGQEVPPQVSRRVLEYANHLAKHTSQVARDMLRLRVPTPHQLARHTAALQVSSGYFLHGLQLGWFYG